ncbi:MAG: formylmethanofuran dehydrogenase subunit B [Candidatus Thorarchaeota archaeon]|nr:formylmethanofuran dehydrogenase subunit B [Candidatus Thorarchaeota archaeon]
MAKELNIFDNVVCPFCGCLCDDIQITTEKNIVTKNQNGCAISQRKFLNHPHDRLSGPSIRKGSSMIATSLESTIKQVAQILQKSRRLLVYGLSSAENDAHREAYKIAELVGGVVDNTSSVCHGPSILGTQESGEAHGSLAEVKHRADFVLYWGANPQSAHPRHIRRYVRVPGEYIKDPKNQRVIYLIDIRKSESAQIVDQFIKIEPGSDLELLGTMRALLHGRRLDVESVAGLSLSAIDRLMTKMKNAKYGVLFYGLGLSQSKGKHRNVDAAIRLVQDLNSFTRWNMLPMRGHYNVAGANKTSTWQTGYPFAVDYCRGYPRYQPGEYTAVDLLLRKECDVFLNVAADPAAHFPRAALEHLKSIPIINLDPKQNMTSLIAAVNIPTAIAGIECDGAAVRMDGLPLYLKKVVEPPTGVFPDRVILKMIYDELRRLS